ncbi:MAG: PAS domain S-box protein [Planctomycetes bacterium]|nr:PAS domain S-box protein [Planctomycetota bacterium]MCC7397304.1 PAS domain S-box protein [Planctomycetota bacterium]
MLREVFDASPSAMLIVDNAGRIVLVNRQAETLFGYDRAQLIGQPVELLVPERCRGSHEVDRAHYMGSPASRPMGAGRDLYGRRADGSEVPIEIGLNPVGEPSGAFVLAAIVDITQRKQAEAELRASLREKETLLREIHHRVKNNMQVVSSLLSLQMQRLGDGGPREAFEECQSRVRTMALIHEKLYVADRLATIAFDEYLRDLSRMILSSYAGGRGDITCELAVEPLHFDVDTAIPLGLIVHELLGNALKHGLRQRGGTVRLGLGAVEPGAFRLEVRDDGTGLPAAFDLQQADGLGLRMITSLARQLDGSLRVENGGSGAAFVVEFRLGGGRRQSEVAPGRNV